MPELKRRQRRELLIRGLLYVPILALLVFQIYETRLSAEKRVGIVIMIEDVPVRIVELTPSSPAATAGLRIGDVLLTIDGVEIGKSLDYDKAAKGFERGKKAAFKVRRGDEELDFPVVPGMPVDWTVTIVNIGIALACLAMGMLTLARRPGSFPSALLNRLFALLAAEVALPPLIIGAPAAAALSTSAYYLILGAQAATYLHLVSVVPERRKWLLRRSWMVPAFYVLGLGPGFLTSLSYAVEDVWKKNLFPWNYEDMEAFMDGPWIFAWSTTLVLILGSAALGQANLQHRRLAAIVLVGTVPWVLHLYFIEIADRLEVYYPVWVEDFSALLLLPFPVLIFLMLRVEDRVRNQILRNLVQGVQDAGSMEKISELISNDLNRAFHTKCNYVFFREGRDSDFTSVHTSGTQLHVEQIPNDYEILCTADQKGDVLAYDAALKAALPVEESEWLDLLEATLVVPLIESDGLMAGLLILGQKRSEEPYTPDDLELLRSLAHQITIAYENLKLQLEAVQRERLQREVLDRLEGQQVNLAQECPVCGFCFDSSEETCPRDGTKLRLTLPVERLINDRYRLEQVLGRGGVAVVYLASDLSLDRGVALKVLARTALDDVHAPRRFEREARVAARLIHPHIVTTHDFGKTRNDLPFIVMEYLEGRTLRQAVKHDGPFDGETLAAWFEQVLDALGAAHALGVVHRDLKPDNVFLVGYPAGKGTVKLLDFGLAKLHTHPSSGESHLTSPGAIMGTLAYMAPEQLAGTDELDQRTDLFSIAVMAYEAALGKRPFSGRNPAKRLSAIAQGDFDFPDDSPEARRLRQVFERCLRSERQERYPSVVELKGDLVPALRECPPLRRRRPPTQEIPRP